MIHCRRYRSVLDVAVVACGVTLIGCSATAAPTAQEEVKSSTAVAVVHQQPASPFDRPGFKTYVKDNRLWVFQEESKDIAEFLTHGEPAKSVTRPGAGPQGMTIRSGDVQSIDAYLVQKPGFRAFIKDGRLWVFREDSKDMAEFTKHGEPAKSITRPGAGPNRMTIRSGDAETIDAYLAQKPGFRTFIKDGRLWVFRDGSKDMAEFKEHGEPAKSVTRPGAGPNRMTIRSGDTETLDAYLTQKPGFRTFIKDGRLWVFRDGSKDMAEFKKHGEPAKSVTRPGAGPNRMTIRSGDAATIDMYLQSL